MVHDFSTYMCILTVCTNMYVCYIMIIDYFTNLIADSAIKSLIARRLQANMQPTMYMYMYMHTHCMYMMYLHVP